MDYVGDKDHRGSGHSTSKWYHRYVLIMAFIVVALSLMDRYVVSILIEQIKADLKLTDLQIGLLVGPAFVLVHVLTQLPLARLADVANRKNMIAISLLLWSAFTLAAGFVKSFPMLLLTRMGVGLTEAGCAPPLASLLSSYFPPEKRAKAMSIFSLGGVTGIGAGMLLGGIVGQEYGWRMALIVAGAPGLLVAALFMVTVREPHRTPAAETVEKSSVMRPSMLATLKTLFAKKSFFWLLCGASLVAVGALGRGVWEPAFLMRTFGLGQANAGLAYFLMSPVPSVVGAFCGGLLADRLCTRDMRWCMWFPAAAMITAFPFGVAFLLWPESDTFFATGIPVAFLFSIAASFLAGLASPVSIATAQNLSPPSMRATAHALWAISTNLIGMGLGPLSAGFLSDYLSPQFGNDSLRYALVIVGSISLLSAVCFMKGARTVRNDVER